MSPVRRLVGTGVVLGLGALAIVLVLDVIASSMQASDDLVWTIAAPVLLTAAVLLSAGRSWRSTDGAWKTALAAGVLAAATFALGWYVTMLIVLSGHPVMIVPGAAFT